MTYCIGEGLRHSSQFAQLLRGAASPAPAFDDAKEQSPSPTIALGAIDVVLFWLAFLLAISQRYIPGFFFCFCVFSEYMWIKLSSSVF